MIFLHFLGKAARSDAVLTTEVEGLHEGEENAPADVPGLQEVKMTENTPGTLVLKQGDQTNNENFAEVGEVHEEYSKTEIDENFDALGKSNSLVDEPENAGDDSGKRPQQNSPDPDVLNEFDSISDSENINFDGSLAFIADANLVKNASVGKKAEISGDKIGERSNSHIKFGVHSSHAVSGKSDLSELRPSALDAISYKKLDTGLLASGKGSSLSINGDPKMEIREKAYLETLEPSEFGKIPVSSDISNSKPIPTDIATGQNFSKGHRISETSEISRTLGQARPISDWVDVPTGSNPLPAINANFAGLTSVGEASTGKDVSRLSSGNIEAEAVAVVSQPQEVARSVTLPARTQLVPQISMKIVENVNAASEGLVEITLEPEDLGKLRMQVVRSDTGWSLNVFAERPETMDLMRRHLDQLQKDLISAGYEDLNIELGNGQSSGGDGLQQGSGNGAVAVEIEDESTDQDRPALSVPGTLDIRI